MEKEGLADRAKKRAHCPFHDDEHESFSVFQGADGFWRYKCFAGCGEGDEIMFLRKLRGLSASEAMNLYLSMANFPAVLLVSLLNVLSLLGLLRLVSLMGFLSLLCLLCVLCPTDKR